MTRTQSYILRLPRHTFFSDPIPPLHPFQNVGVKVVPPSGRKAMADTEEVFSSAFDIEKLLTENFSKETNLDDDDHHHHHHLFTCFSSRTTLKMHNIPATPMLVKKIKTNFDLSNASSSDCIPVMVLKICQSKLSHLSANSSKCVCRNLVF